MSSASLLNEEHLKQQYVDGEISLQQLEARLELALQPELAVKVGFLTLVAGNVINVLQEARDE